MSISLSPDFFTDETLRLLESVGLRPEQLQMRQRNLSDYEVLRMMGLPESSSDVGSQDEGSDTPKPFEEQAAASDSVPAATKVDLAQPSSPAPSSQKPVRLSTTIDGGLVKVRSFVETGKTYLRVPMIYIGSWIHNGEPLVIDEAWMNSVMRNFANNALGYKPPLFLGHPRNIITEEGAPAEGFLVELQREGDTLVGIFECVNPETAAAVESGRYRHASIEFAEIRDKQTGEFLGPAIVGCALTNRPFIPNLESPSVFRLSDELENCADSRLTVVFQMDKVIPTATKMTSTTVDALRSDFESRVAQIEAAYNARLSELEQRFTSLAERHDTERKELLSQIAELQAKLAEAEAEIAAKKLAEKLERLNRMMLSDDIKAEYAKMLQSGELGEVEEKVLATLEKQSEFNRRALTQFGSVSTPVQPERKTSGIFAHIIERNKARRAKSE